MPEAPAQEAAQAVKKDAKKVYYLRPGRTHNVIRRGERVKLSKPNAQVELTDEQFAAFKDKFSPKPLAVEESAEEAEAAPEPAKGQASSTATAPAAPAKPA